MAKEKKPAQPKAEAVKQPKEAKPKKEKKAKAAMPQGGVRLPRSAELVLSVSKMVVLVMGVTVFGVSLFHGVDPLMIMLRVAVTVLLLGFVFYFISWMYLRDSLDAALKPLAIEEDSSENAQTTIGKEA